MAHNLELQADGTYSYIGNAPAWHGLGYVSDHLLTYDEIKEHCLNWDVYTDALYDKQGVELPINGIFRADNNAYLGCGSPKKHPIPHHVGFRMVASLLGQEACFATAGALGVGERVWGLGYIGESTLGDDKSVNYLLYSKSYNGRADIYQLTKVRVVCNNTLNLALGQHTPVVRVRNTKRGEELLIDRIKAMDSLRQGIEHTDNEIKLLANTLATNSIIEDTLITLFPLTKKIDEVTKTPVLVSPTRRNNIVEKIMETYEYNDGGVFPEQKGTLYNLFNSITNYVDHTRTKNKDNEERDTGGMSAMFGSGDVIKRSAYAHLIGVASSAPSRPTATMFLPSPETEIVSEWS